VAGLSLQPEVCTSSSEIHISTVPTRQWAPKPEILQHGTRAVRACLLVEDESRRRKWITFDDALFNGSGVRAPRLCEVLENVLGRLSLACARLTTHDN